MLSRPSRKTGDFVSVVENVKPVVENVETCMLTLQRLLRSRPKWNFGTAHIFWYMKDEHTHLWCHPETVCFHGLYELCHEHVYIIFDS